MRTVFLITAALFLTSMAAYANDEAWKAWEAKHAHLKPWMDTNNDGVIDKHEKDLVRLKWKHLNPPGWTEGEKTGWEGGTEPPGLRKDRDDNPPGPVGGKGTNWENPPGPKGGKGASPNRKK